MYICTQNIFSPNLNYHFPLLLYMNFESQNIHTRLVKLIITPHNQACKTFKCLVVSVGTLLTS